MCNSRIDGGNFGAEDTTSPYSVSWTTGSVPDGSHVLSAVARDAAGHSTTASVTVTVSNAGTPPQTLLTTQCPAAQGFTLGPPGSSGCAW